MFLSIKTHSSPLYIITDIPKKYLPLFSKIEKDRRGYLLSY